MKSPVKVNRNKIRGYSFIFLLVLLTQCFFLDGVEQPTTAKAGETIDIKVNVRVDSKEARTSVRLVMGFLVPKKWKAGENTIMSLTSSKDNSTMSRVPAGAKPKGSTLDWSDALMAKLGVGPNLINDMEWIVFWTDKTFDIVNGDQITGYVTITTKVGDDNMLVKLGYALGETEDSIDASDYFKSQFTDCFSVTDGAEPLIDFCFPQLSVVDPRQSLDNDFISISFDGAVIPTALDGADPIFLCAKGYTSDSQVIEMCEQTSQAQLVSLGLNRWRIELWPREYFGLTDGQTLNSVAYYFTNQEGSVMVGYGGSSDPFKILFVCE